MPLHTWWLYVLAVFLVSAMPGPNMLHVMARSVDFGFRRSTATMAGCLAGLVILLVASVAGLSTVLVAMPGLFTALRYAGAAYLIYLGVRAWRTRAIAADVGLDIGAGTLPAPRTAGAPREVGSGALFRGGLAISLSNPKAILFAAAFLPQFINPAQPTLPQFGILLATFVAIESFWYSVYGLGGRTMARQLNHPKTRRVFDRVTGTAFIGFGLGLLASRA
ncbi:LysE family translocator [Novosphingobium sp. 1949]|uniref:LysE family translocator n=1 Tax=Novosphingobium organovorum TaxID=2930092 RepID=A0ABT0BJF8_9SPHN|nr:LysE family translocator [Novosphingobium organovorum]MCJ2184983.1 LysE family translocator [Novosphingobium organovorum]